MNKKNEITLWGYYGFNNLGDDVMLDVCLKEIKSTKKYETINVYGNYQEIDKIDGVVFHPLAGIKNKVEFLKSILKSDKLIWGGGTCFYKDNNTGYSGLFLLFVISLFCVLFRKKNFFLGIGLGKLNSSLSRVLTIITLSLSTLSIFRDVNSYNKALSLVNPKKVGFGGDLVLLYDILERSNKFYGIERRYISVSGHYAYANDVGYIENFTCAIIKIAKHHNIKDIVFVSMHQMPESNDHIFHKKLKTKLPDNFNLLFSDYVDSVNLLKNSTFHIGMRLHSIVFASINSVPIVPFSYSPKINSFINTMFLDAKVFDGYSNIFNLSIDDLICKEINNENLNAEKDRALITIKHVLSF